MKLFVVVERESEYNDYTYDLREGGTLLQAYRSKERAEAVAREKNATDENRGQYEPPGDKYHVQEVECETAEDAYKATQDKVKEMKAKAKSLMQDAFKEGAAALFDKHPALTSFSWTQYTPYFNDGEACNFGVRSGGEVNGTDTYDLGDDQTELKAAGEEFAQFVSSFDEDDMRSMFGDHMKVTVNRGGKIEADEYDHE